MRTHLLLQPKCNYLLLLLETMFLEVMCYDHDNSFAVDSQNVNGRRRCLDHGILVCVRWGMSLRHVAGEEELWHGAGAWRWGMSLGRRSCGEDYPDLHRGMFTKQCPMAPWSITHLCLKRRRNHREDTGQSDRLPSGHTPFRHRRLHVYCSGTDVPVLEMTASARAFQRCVAHGQRASTGRCVRAAGRCDCREETGGAVQGRWIPVDQISQEPC